MKRPNLASRNQRRRFSFAASVSAARGGAAGTVREGREAAPERTENIRIRFRILFIRLSLRRERFLFTARHVRLAGNLTAETLPGERRENLPRQRPATEPSHTAQSFTGETPVPL